MYRVTNGHLASRYAKRRYFMVALTFLLLGAAICFFVYFSGADSSLVPNDIRKAAGFTLYYPDLHKLPAGYAIDTTSFRRADGGVVLFSVSYDKGRSMVFSEQAQPGQDVIEKFKATAIPVNTKLSLPLGQATIGAYNSGKKIQTIASLPVTNGPWLIITAPSDINQNELKQVIESLKK